jgi:hypothetical protein
VSEVEIPPQEEISYTEKLVHLALPVRLTHMAKGDRSGIEMACTYDIHTKGARFLSFRDVKIGDLITVERGRNKSVCQVIWTADPDSALRGQFTVECRGQPDSVGRGAAANAGTVFAHRSRCAQEKACDEQLPQRRPEPPP